MQSIDKNIGQDKAHSLAEFPNFPWEDVDPKTCGVSRGGITAGLDFNPYRPHICFVGNDGFVDDWEIPQELADMLRQHREWGQRDKVIEIRSVLSLED
jgi:hypothetical protein